MSELSHRVPWFELRVTDLERATAFYSEVLDVEITCEVLSGIPQAILTADPDAITGAWICDPARTPRPGIGTLVARAGAGGTSSGDAGAVAGGARGRHPVTAIRSFGEFARIEDHDGNVVGLYARA